MNNHQKMVFFLSKKFFCAMISMVLLRDLEFFHFFKTVTLPHSQAVRQESAKLSFPGPIPGGASKRSLVNQLNADLQGFFFS